MQALFQLPPLRRLRLERPLRAVYEGMHAYRAHVRLLVFVFVVTAFLQGLRVLAIWLAGKSVATALCAASLIG